MTRGKDLVIETKSLIERNERAYLFSYDSETLISSYYFNIISVTICIRKTKAVRKGGFCFASAIIAL